MKLIYLCSSKSWGGLELNQLRNALWMHKRGHEVLVLGCENSPYLNKALEWSLPTITIDPYRKYYAFGNALKLARILKNEEATHLFIRDTRDMSMMASLKFLLKKSITTVYFMEMQLGVSKKNLLHTLRFSFLDFWSCPLQGLMKQVQEKTRFNPKRLLLIPSGLDRASLISIDKESARNTLNLPESALIFGLIGRLDPQKGQHLLVEALVKLKSEQIHIVFLGESTKGEGDQYFNNLKELISNEKLSKQVHFRPFREDVSVFFSAIDWMVMATKAETFGMVSIESMACGTPVLGSNAGGTPEILNFGKLGVLFESMNSMDLFLKMQGILDGSFDIDANLLQESTAPYDHNKVCTAVEEQVLNFFHKDLIA
jgi:glycosyltransferase involved in cell wall biosynthesis